MLKRTKYLQTNLVKFKKVLFRLFLRPNCRKHPTFDIFHILDNGFGALRGTPIDCVLIDKFLREQLATLGLPKDVSVMEIGDSRYMDSLLPFASKVILRLDKGTQIRFENNELKGDLTLPTEINSVFDCIIATQVLAFTSNPFAASSSLLNLLKPGGWLIGTEPQFSTISLSDYYEHGDYFRFSPMGIISLFRNSPHKFDGLYLSHLGSLQDSLNLLIGRVSEDGVKI